jgi:hypothetical protein
MINKYGLYILSGSALFFSIFGAYMQTVNERDGNMLILLSVFTTTMFLIYLLLYIKKIRKELQNKKSGST